LVRTVGRAGLTTPATSSTASRARGDRGFALYELVLALAIIGLIAAVVFPRVTRGTGAAELRAKAQDVAALLRTDRNVALRRGREVLSLVDLEAGVVTSGTSAWSVAIPRGVKMEFVQSSREARADGGGIRFRPNGRSSGGVLFLRRQDTSYQVSVNWLTSGIWVGVARQPGG
jgi:general secretion pathway protein H